MIMKHARAAGTALHGIMGIIRTEINVLNLRPFRGRNRLAVDRENRLVGLGVKNHRGKLAAARRDMNLRNIRSDDGVLTIDI